MINVSDVCKELESLWCLDANNECFATCTEKKKQAVRDAIVLLKAQEPRVITQEELAAVQETPVWRETKRVHKDLYNGWVLAYDIQKGEGITGTRLGMSEPSGCVVWYRLDDYGKTWRCWTSQPTEEQRKATPWN